MLAAFTRVQRRAGGNAFVIHCAKVRMKSDGGDTAGGCGRAPSASTVTAHVARRGIPHTLDKEQTAKVLATSQCCVYCGDGTVTGLDRVSSFVGYVPDNVVPCCAICNMVKGQMTADLFVSQCKAIAEAIKTLQSWP